MPRRHPHNRRPTVSAALLLESLEDRRLLSGAAVPVHAGPAHAVPASPHAEYRLALVPHSRDVHQRHDAPAAALALHGNGGGPETHGPRHLQDAEADNQHSTPRAASANGNKGSSPAHSGARHESGDKGSDNEQSAPRGPAADNRPGGKGKHATADDRTGEEVHSVGDHSSVAKDKTTGHGHDPQAEEPSQSSAPEPASVVKGSRSVGGDDTLATSPPNARQGGERPDAAPGEANAVGVTEVGQNPEPAVTVAKAARVVRLVMGPSASGAVGPHAVAEGAQGAPASTVVGRRQAPALGPMRQVMTYGDAATGDDPAPQALTGRPAQRPPAVTAAAPEEAPSGALPPADPVAAIAPTRSNAAGEPGKTTNLSILAALRPEGGENGRPSAVAGVPLPGRAPPATVRVAAVEARAIHPAASDMEVGPLPGGALVADGLPLDTTALQAAIQHFLSHLEDVGREVTRTLRENGWAAWALAVLVGAAAAEAGRRQRQRSRGRVALAAGPDTAPRPWTDDPFSANEA